MRVHDGLEIHWLGHAMFRLRTPGGKIVFIDPFIEQNPAFPENGRGVLDKADLILVTHAHSDHMGDAESLAKRTDAPIVCVAELGMYFDSRGVNAMGMNKGSEVPIGDLGLVMTHAEHSSGFQDEEGNLVPGGEPVGYVLRLEDGYRVYHAGDTAAFGDMALIRLLWAPDLALLPIGGYFVMGPREAAHAARLLGARTVIPMHYGTWPMLSGTPDALAKELEGSGITVKEMKPGDRTEA